MNNQTQTLPADEQNLLAEAQQVDVINLKQQDFAIAGAVVEFDPDEAEIMGSFIEEALSTEDAKSSVFDDQ